MNDTQQNNRTWSDALGLVLFSAGALASALLVLALTQDPVTGQASTKTAAMGHALLWAGGAVPASMMSLACLLLGAAQFLGFQEALRVTRHLVGVLGLAVGLSIVLGAFSDVAGGRFGVVIGGGLADLSSSLLAAMLGLGVISGVVWAVWMTPTRAEAWERAQEIERPAVSLQAKADGVTSEESAALAFEGESETDAETVESPYPEDVRVHGQIPEGATALVAEEMTNHVEIEEGSGLEDRGDHSPFGSEGAAEAAQEADVVPVETYGGDERTASEDLALVDDATEFDSAAVPDYEDELTPSQDLEEAEPEESFEVDEEEPSDGEELEDTADEVSEGEDVDGKEGGWAGDEELEGEDVDSEDEEVEEDDAAGYEEDESEELEEDDPEIEEEGGDGDLEEEDEGEIEDEAERDYEEAAQLEEGEASEDPEPGGAPEGQGDLFEMEEEEEASPEAEVVLEPQTRPAEDTEEILMKAADLFLDRDRVAVSLLQRQFQLDFEASCAILDELQERGLIGPYLGGNRRDILLTREEWLERVEGAT